jgi:hypothetical protein
MKVKFYKEKGFYLTLLTSTFIILIAFVTQHYKNLFVPVTGNIKIIGGIGVLLAIGLLFKVRYTRQLLAIIILFAIIGVISIMLNSGKEFILAYSILLLTLGFIEYQLFFSIPVLRYVKK